LVPFDNRLLVNLVVVPLDAMSLPLAERGLRGDWETNPTGNCVSTVRDAIAELRKVPQISFMFFVLSRHDVESEDVRMFPAFVAALDGHDNVDTLHFSHAPFFDYRDDTSPQYDDLERLFGTVLPNLPRLKYLYLIDCELHQRCAELLFEALPDGRQPLLQLDLSNTLLTPGACQVLAGALRRNGLSTLTLKNARLDSESGTVLVQAAADSSHLLSIELADVDWTWTVTPAFWAGGAMVRATVRSLAVDAAWTDAGMVELFRQLRANVSLRVLDVRGSVSDLRIFELLEELLSTYNFTITRIGRGVPKYYKRRRIIEAILLRNERVRKMNDQLRIRNYHVQERNVWPRVLRDTGTFPTLVYRFLRAGNVVGLADQVRSNSRVNKRRSADS
jgi:hypothetical protein